MTTEAAILAVVAALKLPSEARVDVRVPKKLLVEQGAPTSADKRAIQEGIDELNWLAACKPTTIGVPAFSDEIREYLEIAVVACAFRPDSKAARLIELIHRAIPYPVVLITVNQDDTTLSLAHKRRAQNEAGKVVIERVVSVAGLGGDHESLNELAFLESLALAKQSRRDLCDLYEGWVGCIEALSAARLNGTFVTTEDVALIERRRDALEVHTRLTREIVGLRAKVHHEKQMNRRVDLNMAIQRLEAEIANQKKNL